MGHLDEVDVDGGHVLGAQDAERPQRGVGGEPGVRVGRELLAQRIAETHVHAALDLADAQQRVDGPADVVDRRDTFDRPARPVDLDHLSRVPERGVDRGVGVAGVAQVLGPVDDVFALEVDLLGAATGERGSARLLHRPCGHQRAARAGGLAEPEMPCGVDDDLDARRVDAELLGGHLQRHGVNALAHLGPPVAHLDRAVGPETYDRA